MEVLHTFGFEWTLFAAQIVNFLLLFWILKKLLYKPVLKMLDDRRHKIEQGLKHAEEADRRLEQTLEKESKILKEAQEQARKMLNDAKEQQALLLREAETATQEKVESMLNEARSQITHETAEAEKRLTASISKLAVDFLQEAITGLFGAKEQEIIMQNAIKKLKDKKVA
jgi:F-type H+-transporting ATPase subunit b